MHIYPVNSLNFCATPERKDGNITKENQRYTIKEETVNYKILKEYSDKFYTIEYCPKYRPGYSSKIMKDYSDNKIKTDYNNWLKVPYKTRYFDKYGAKKSVIYKNADLTPCICKIYDTENYGVINEILVADFEGEQIAQMSFGENGHFEMLFDNGEANYKFYSKYSADMKTLVTDRKIAKRTKATNESITTVYLSENNKMLFETIYNKSKRNLGFVFYDKNEIPCATCVLNFNSKNEMYAKCTPVCNLYSNTIDGILIDNKAE